LKNVGESSLPVRFLVTKKLGMEVENKKSNVRQKKKKEKK